ncbi:MAG: sodium:proton antiporter, partial [Anaerolineales bacterium]|nr:sodium:proton antiporter [Anaerolineales bacterium]
MSHPILGDVMLQSEFVLTEITYVILLAVAAVVAIATRHGGILTRVPYTVALVTVGLAATLLAPRFSSPFSSDLILFLLVPPLLFESTLSLQWRNIRRDLLPILLFALAGTLISTFLVAYAIDYFPGLNVSFPAAIAFGALISATDPVAVIAFFRSLGVSKRLTMLVEGESLFNDGVAIVIFTLALAAGEAIELGEAVEFSAWSAISDFVMIAGGGIIVGVVMGGFVSYVILKNVDDHLIETATTLALAFGSFLVAEEFGLIIGNDHLHLSGILAVVAAGLFVGNIGRQNTSPTTSVALDNFWEFLAYIVNSLVFLVIGLTIDLSQFGTQLLMIIFAVILVLVVRFVVIYGVTGLNNLVSPERAIPGVYRQVMVWGGLRGAISLALALTLSEGPFAEYANELQLMAFGVVLFTLLVQGMTIERLIIRLGLSGKADHVLEQQRQQALLYANLAGRTELDRLSQEGILTPEVHNALKEAYDREILARREVFRRHMQHYPELEEEMVMQARADILRAERNAIGDAYRRGLIEESTFERLVREINERNAAL